jgi:hypothetical protein
MDVEITHQSMNRRSRVGGDEVDALSPGHRFYAYRPGQSSRSAIKGRHNRRVRRVTRQELRSRV